MTATSVTPRQLLVAEGLHKSYWVAGTEVPAVRDVGFELAPSSALGVVGESGSGKSTLARIVVGLERPDQGTVSIAGAALDEQRGRAGRLAKARLVQMVFQDPYLSLDPLRTVRQALADPIRLHFSPDRPALNRRVRELLDQVGLGEREADALPRYLSGGQRQRVAIARALAVEPTVLVMDEAVSALDVSVQAQVLNLLVDIRRETEIAVVFVSHDLAVVRHVCDEALVMLRGRVVERGPVTALTDRPQHPYTQLLRASVPERGWDPGEISHRRRRLIATLGER